LLAALSEKQPEQSDATRCGHPFDLDRRDDDGRYLAGLHVDCDLPPFHTGNHLSDHGVFSIHWVA
jgi:hypothetical protein